MDISHKDSAEAATAFRNQGPSWRQLLGEGAHFDIPLVIYDYEQKTM